MKDKIAICVVADFKFLNKFFNSFKKNLRNNGNFHGEVLIITDYFTPTFLFPSILFDSKVKVKRFSRIKFSSETDNSLSRLNSNHPNRHINKSFQWHKVNLFSTKLKKWNYIFYMDINMKIHHDINDPCEMLWDRMYIWFDGKVNPCDSDYKSYLSYGNCKNSSIREVWKSEKITKIREQHLQNDRIKIDPCNKCGKNYI